MQILGAVSIIHVSLFILASCSTGSLAIKLDQGSLTLTATDAAWGVDSNASSNSIPFCGHRTNSINGTSLTNGVRF
jgi:hypothetical protein